MPFVRSHLSRPVLDAAVDRRQEQVGSVWAGSFSSGWKAGFLHAQGWDPFLPPAVSIHKCLTPRPHFCSLSNELFQRREVVGGACHPNPGNFPTGSSEWFPFPDKFTRTLRTEMQVATWRAQQTGRTPCSPPGATGRQAVLRGQPQHLGTTGKPVVEPVRAR